MILVSATNLVRRFDTEPVLDHVSFEVRSDERIGLVGPNGAGKTTLLRILADLDHADSGEVNVPGAVKLALLRQQPNFAPGQTLYDVAKQGLARVFQLQQESLEVADALAITGDDELLDKLHKRFDAIQAELQHLNGFQVEYRLDQVLSGLGFSREQYTQPVESLSGGQQNRLLLAQMLLQAPDVMLLDEPTNHLDIDATEWLEQYLRDVDSAIVLVSHDRYFLDRVCNRILELNRGQLTDYPGNFTQYWRLRGERQVQADKIYAKQQQEIAKTVDFIRRNGYGQLAKQAKDREHKLARIEQVERIASISGPRMSFPDAARTGDWVIDAEGLTKGFDRVLFREVNLRVERGDRLGIFGPNGTGKTTLLRTLVGELSPDQGRVRLGANVDIAYFDQQLLSVDPKLDAMEAIRPDDVAKYSDGQLRDILARFGITGEQAMQSVGAMSGGERSKVALARIASHGPNVLILDEPTNHLDLWSRDSLEQALREFGGTLLFVSHDRYFLDQIATRVVVVERDRWFQTSGNYSDYIAFRKAIEAEAAGERAENSKNTSKAVEKTTSNSKDQERRRRKFPYRKVFEIEADIAGMEATIAQCLTDLGNPDIHRQVDRFREVQETYERSQAALAELYEHWEEAVELN